MLRCGFIATRTMKRADESGSMGRKRLRSSTGDDNESPACSSPHVDWEDMAAVTAEFKALANKVSVLRKSGASKVEVDSTISRLLSVKKIHRTLVLQKRRLETLKKKTPLAAHSAYPAKVERTALRDPEHPEFTVSFRLSDGGAEEEARRFFDTHGFVVIRDVLSPEECKASQDEIWTQLAENHPGFSRDSPETWSLLSSKTYGLPPTQAIFSSQLLKNRQHPNLVKAYQLLLNDERILVSQDRWCAYRPTKTNTDWATRENLHLDVQPWSYISGTTDIEHLKYESLVDFITETNAVAQSTGPHVQGVLNLSDNRDEDGGTQLVPGFHRSFTKWFDLLGDIEDNRNEGARNRNWVIPRRQGGGSYKFSPEDPIHSLSHRIALRAGSLLVWNQEVVHGSKANRSNEWRTAQFIKAFRLCPVSQHRLKSRTAKVQQLIRDAGLDEEVTDLGKGVFYGEWKSDRSSS